jgi:hypothetical protein
LPWIALLNLASIPSGEQSVVLNWPALGHVAQPTRTVSARPTAIKIFGDLFAMSMQRLNPIFDRLFGLVDLLLWCKRLKTEFAISGAEAER